MIRDGVRFFVIACCCLVLAILSSTFYENAKATQVAPEADAFASFESAGSASSLQAIVEANKTRCDQLESKVKELEQKVEACCCVCPKPDPAFQEQQACVDCPAKQETSYQIDEFTQQATSQASSCADGSCSSGRLFPNLLQRRGSGRLFRR